MILTPKTDDGFEITCLLDEQLADLLGRPLLDAPGMLDPSSSIGLSSWQ